MPRKDRAKAPAKSPGPGKGKRSRAKDRVGAGPGSAKDRAAKVRSEPAVRDAAGQFVAPGASASSYEKKKAAAADRSRRESAAGRDLPEIPKPADPARRAEHSLHAFLLSHFPERFPIEFSPDHLKVIAALERAIDHGGLFALAMPRGSGKTTMCECAAIWAVLKGRHDFVALVGATQDAAVEMLAAIKSELENNDLLAADFPEVCVPIRELEGRTQRCRGQTYQGQPTRIQWKEDWIVLPKIPGSKASEAVIKVAGITGRVRGMKYSRSDGRVVRPSFVIPDDPQTDDSALSPLQCARRMKVMNGALLKLAGPKKAISAVCPCTVIRRGDMADQLLDRERNPHWQGERCKMLYAMPTRMDLWQQYAALRAESLRAGGRGEQAREFYLAHQAEMEEGSKVAWPQRLDPGDVSALETALKLFFDDRFSFQAECQNEPIDEDLGEDRLRPADLVTRFSGRPRGVAPAWADKLTAFIDVQGTLLYWLVAAWKSADFTGAVLDYGSWPTQPGRKYFTLSDARLTIQDALPGAGLEAQIRRALDDCETFLLDRDWQREDGTALRIGRLLKDAGFEMDTVFEQSRSSRFAAVAMPSRGVPIGPLETPMAEYRPKSGEELKFHVILTTPPRRAIRWAKMDANFWKSFLSARLRQPPGQPGNLTFFGTSRGDADHDMLADHLTSEKPAKATAKGRTVTVWELPPGTENHFLDCLYGAAAAAAIDGVHLAGQAGPARRGPTLREQREQAMKKIGKAGRR